MENCLVPYVSTLRRREVIKKKSGFARGAKLLQRGLELIALEAEEAIQRKGDQLLRRGLEHTASTLDATVVEVTKLRDRLNAHVASNKRGQPSSS